MDKKLSFAFLIHSIITSLHICKFFTLRNGPLLVVASGRDTIPVASSIKRLAPEHVFVVQV